MTATSPRPPRGWRGPGAAGRPSRRPATKRTTRPGHRRPRRSPGPRGGRGGAGARRWAPRPPGRSRQRPVGTWAATASPKRAPARGMVVADPGAEVHPVHCRGPRGQAGPRDRDPHRVVDRRLRRGPGGPDHDAPRFQSNPAPRTRGAPAPCRVQREVIARMRPMNSWSSSTATSTSPSPRAESTGHRPGRHQGRPATVNPRSGASAASPTSSTTAPRATTSSSTSSEPAPLDELDRTLRLADDVLRHKIVRIPEQAARPQAQRRAPAAG